MSERNIPLEAKIKRSFLALTLTIAGCGPIQKLNEGLCRGGFNNWGNSYLNEKGEVVGLQFERDAVVNHVGYKSWEVQVGATNYIPQDGLMYPDGSWETVVATNQEQIVRTESRRTRTVYTDTPFSNTLTACVDKYGNIYWRY
jgi:hypothetical protein